MGVWLVKMGMVRFLLLHTFWWSRANCRYHSHNYHSHSCLPYSCKPLKFEFGRGGGGGGGDIPPFCYLYTHIEKMHLTC